MRTLAITLSTAAILALVAIGAAAPAAQDAKDTLPGATNYTRVDATVACGGATAPGAFAELKRRGFVAVVNFRTADEPGANVAAEADATRQAGLTYFHLPFASSAPSTAVAGEFLTIVADPANQPVYIHCASANRVGAMWLIKRVRLDGWDVAKATAEAEAIGLRSPALKQFAIDYLSATRE